MLWGLVDGAETGVGLLSGPSFPSRLRGDPQAELCLDSKTPVGPYTSPPPPPPHTHQKPQQLWEN